MTNYKKLELDKNKRHFVFGDIHGRMNGITKLLKLIKYNPDTDVLYSVGDLIDRGIDSVKCIEFFTEGDNKHTVMGNHEYMAIDKSYEHTWFNNGGWETIESLNGEMRDRKWLEEKIKTLPFVIDVGDSSDPDSFRILHAEVPFGITENQLMERLTKDKRGNLTNMLQWGRNIMRTYQSYRHHTDSDQVIIDFAAKIKAHNSRFTITGHTPVRDPIILGNQAFVDTGYHKLTCINALTKEFFTVDAGLADQSDYL